MRGVAVRLQEFTNFLDSNGIPYRPKKVLCKKLKRNKKCRLKNMKQYFLKTGVTVRSCTGVKRCMSICKGCVCVPQDTVEEGFLQMLQQGTYVRFLGNIHASVMSIGSGGHERGVVRDHSGKFMQ